MDQRSMRAFRKLSDVPGDVRIAEVDVPVPGESEVVVEVAACGLCGGDVHAYRADPGYEWIPTPLTLGHEFSGVVRAVGDGVERTSVGDPVVAVSVQGCGVCGTCRAGRGQLCDERRFLGMGFDGGLASYAVLSERHLVPADGVDLVTAALTEPLSVAIHAVSQVGGSLEGRKVVVTGPGPIGTFCGLVAQAGGAEVLLVGTAADEARLQAAGRAGLTVARVEGADEPHPAEAYFSAEPEVWIEASGAPQAANAALSLLEKGGHLVVVAMYTRPVEVSMTDAVRKHLTLHFSYASDRSEYATALELLRSGRIELDGLFDSYSLEEAPQAIANAASSEGLKPVVRIGGRDA